MLAAKWQVAVAVLFLLGVGDVGRGAEPLVARYRVEQLFRLETTSAEPQPLPGRVRADPVTTAVEGRVRLVLEQRLEPGTPARGAWRFTQVEVEGPRSEPPEASNPGVERALRLGLDWMRRLAGEEFSGSVADLPVIPLGEATPAWLTSWLRWAQIGSFAGVEGSPVDFPSASGAEPLSATYAVEWLRSEFRQRLCHVQRARWTLPVAPAATSLPPSLAAEGVEARTHFAAQSLEWVTQQDPTLIYAERSGVREIFWDMEKVSKPELRNLVFRLRLAVETRVERMP
jgi:hypothetical protein